MDLESAEREKRAKELDTLFKTLMGDGHELIGAARCSLFILDRPANELWSKVATGASEVIRVPADKGFVGACVKSKQIISVDDAYDDSRFNRSVDEATNFKTRSVMCVPVLNDAGDVVAVVQMINAERGVFDANDEKLGRMLAKHVAIFMAEIE